MDVFISRRLSPPARWRLVSSSSALLDGAFIHKSQIFLRGSTTNNKKQTPDIAITPSVIKKVSIAYMPQCRTLRMIVPADGSSCLLLSGDVGGSPFC
jgi:hypothetical protein